MCRFEFAIETHKAVRCAEQYVAHPIPCKCIRTLPQKTANALDWVRPKLDGTVGMVSERGECSPTIVLQMLWASSLRDDNWEVSESKGVS